MNQPSELAKRSDKCRAAITLMVLSPNGEDNYAGNWAPGNTDINLFNLSCYAGTAVLLYKYLANPVVNTKDKVYVPIESNVGTEL